MTSACSSNLGVTSGRVKMKRCDTFTIGLGLCQVNYRVLLAIKFQLVDHLFLGREEILQTYKDKPGDC